MISRLNNLGFISPNIKIPVLEEKFNVAILASGNGSNFEAVVNSVNSNNLNVNIVILITNNKSAHVINRAKKLNIPYTILEHKMFSDRRLYDKQLLDILHSNKIDFIVMAGWMRIVTSTLINSFKDKIINIHPSILPSFTGANAINAAIMSGVTITGCSVHLVTEEVDGGPLLIQASVPILDNDSKESLTERIRVYEHKILPIGIALAIKRIISMGNM